jgi:hypothetical protein
MPKIKDIAAALKADLTGDGEITVEGINHPAAAGARDLALALEESALSALGQSAAPAAIVMRGAETPARLRAVIAVDFPRYAMATLTRLFAGEPHKTTGIHPTAVVDPSAVIEDSVSIGPFVAIGPGARIGRAMASASPFPSRDRRRRRAPPASPASPRWAPSSSAPMSRSAPIAASTAAPSRRPPSAPAPRSIIWS